MRFTAAIAHERPWWVARCLEVEVTSQGENLEQARANLAEALSLYFQDEPGDLSVGEAPIIAPVDVDVHVDVAQDIVRKPAMRPPTK